MTNQNQLNVGYFFPTAIGVCDELLTTDELKIVQDSCETIIKTTPNSLNSNWLSEQQSPFNTMQSCNIVTEKDFSVLCSEVSNKVKEFALHHADNGDYVCDHAWLNSYKYGQFQEPHSHSFPAIYSAVYYPEASETSGRFVIERPCNVAQIEQNLVGPNPLTDTKRWFEPKTNMLIVFKSSLNHYVLPNGSADDKRISIAFNFSDRQLPTGMKD